MRWVSKPFLTKEEQIQHSPFFNSSLTETWREKKHQPTTTTKVKCIFWQSLKTNKKNLCNIVINIDIIICKVFYSVIGFKAMFLCLPVKYCKQTLGEVGWVWDGCGREGSLNRLACHWLVWKRVNSNLTGCHLLLSAVISLLLWVCIRHYVYTVGQSTLASLQRNAIQDSCWRINFHELV